MTIEWDIPDELNISLEWGSYFPAFYGKSLATYFPVAEVLYHCAAQVQQRSTAQARHCSNAFHLTPNEMRSAVHFKSWSCNCPPCNLFDRHVWRFLLAKATPALPHNVCNFGKFPCDSSCPLCPIFERVVSQYTYSSVLARLWYVTNRRPHAVLILSPPAAMYPQSFHKCVLAKPTHQVCIRSGLCGLGAARYHMRIRDVCVRRSKVCTIKVF